MGKAQFCMWTCQLLCIEPLRTGQAAAVELDFACTAAVEAAVWALATAAAELSVAAADRGDVAADLQSALSTACTTALLLSAPC